MYSIWIRKDKLTNWELAITTESESLVAYRIEEYCKGCWSKDEPACSIKVLRGDVELFRLFED